MACNAWRAGYDLKRQLCATAARKPVNNRSPLTGNKLCRTWLFMADALIQPMREPADPCSHPYVFRLPARRVDAAPGAALRRGHRRLGGQAGGYGPQRQPRVRSHKWRGLVGHTRSWGRVAELPNQRAGCVRAAPWQCHQSADIVRGTTQFWSTACLAEHSLETARYRSVADINLETQGP